MLKALIGAAALAILMSCAGARGIADAADTIGFELDGHARQYLIHVPRGASGPMPLVLILHGGGGNARGMVRLTRGRWDELADREGFIAVYPDSLDRMWDFGEGTVSDALDVRVDDLAYFREVIRRVNAEHDVDPARIFATGISRGGQASFYLACNLPGTIRAIAPVAMPLPAFMEDECRAAPPVGLMVVNGTADPLVPYDGGEITVFRRKRGQVLSTDATVQMWRQRNGCSGVGMVEKIDRPGDRTSVVRTDWTDCAGAPVTLIRVENGGHTWPGGRPYLGRRLVGEVSGDIDATEEIWRFFAQF